MKEYQHRTKSNQFVDKRLGESDPNMSVEDKMMQRFALERQVRVDLGGDGHGKDEGGKGGKGGGDEVEDGVMDPNMKVENEMMQHFVLERQVKVGVGRGGVWKG